MELHPRNETPRSFVVPNIEVSIKRLSNQLVGLNNCNFSCGGEFYIANIQNGSDQNLIKLGVRVIIIAIPLVFLAIFFYYPLTQILGQGLTNERGITFGPVLNIFKDPYFQDVIIFTAKQAFLSVIASILLGLPWAYIFIHYEFPLKKTLKSLTIVPFVLPSITVVIGFIIFFGNNGMLNRFLMDIFHLNAPPLRILYSLSGIILAHAFYNAPLIARMVHAQWERIDISYEESARALGAGRIRTFFEITLPLVLPGLMTGAALVFIFCFLSFPIVLALGGAQFSTIEVEIYTLVKTLLNYKLGAALSLVEIILSLIFIYGYIKVESLFSHELESTRPRPTAKLFGSPNLGRLIAWLFIFISGIIFLGPMVSIFADSLTAQWGGNTTITLKWYTYILRPHYEALIGASPLQSILNSIFFGLTAMSCASLVGLPIAYAIARYRFRYRRIFDTLTMAPLGVSSVALGFALLLIFLEGPLAIAGRPTAIILAHSILAYPFFIRAVVPVLESIERNLIDAARSLGASSWRAFMDVELPLVSRGFLVGAVFAFAISLGEMSATIMLTKPKLSTMPVTIYNLIGARKFGQASAMSVLLILVTGVTFVIIERFGERVFRK